MGEEIAKKTLAATKRQEGGRKREKGVCSPQKEEEKLRKKGGKELCGGKVRGCSQRTGGEKKREEKGYPLSRGGRPNWKKKRKLREKGNLIARQVQKKEGGGTKDEFLVVRGKANLLQRRRIGPPVGFESFGKRKRKKTKGLAVPVCNREKKKDREN